MDSIDFDNVKAEKAKALRRYNRFQRIGRFFRAAEVCVAIVFIFWTFTRLPFAVQISREFLRRIAGVVSTPLFVFLLGNCIVLVLLAKSSDQTTGGSTRNAETEIYQALVRPVEDRSKPSDEEEIVYDDKEVIVTDSNPNSNIDPRDENDAVEVDHTDASSESVADQPKVYGRSKSDVSGKQSADHMASIPKPSSLRRSETDRCRRILVEDNKYSTWAWEAGKAKEEDGTNNYPEDNLSNEEFQKTIEAFIAKQLMFRRRESLAVVVHNKA